MKLFKGLILENYLVPTLHCIGAPMKNFKFLNLAVSVVRLYASQFVIFLLNNI